MTNVQEVLRTRKLEIEAEMEALRNEQTRIDTALTALDDEKHDDASKPVKREDAIVEAVKHGKRKPQDIHKFLTRNMGVKIPLGSLRSTLTRLKSEGRIHHDGSGWIM
ncbi:hypothetical protein [Rhizobium phage RHph_X2_24]|nr:hypothetical protein [Rhizobium phage RHph_X2_24]